MKTTYNYETCEDDVVLTAEEFVYGTLILGGVATVLGAAFGAIGMRKKFAKILPDLIDECGCKGAIAATQAMAECGPNASEFVDRNARYIGRRACDLFYSDKSVKKALKEVKKYTNR